jgi:hypothetical protein
VKGRWVEAKMREVKGRREAKGRRRGSRGGMATYFGMSSFGSMWERMNVSHSLQATYSPTHNHPRGPSASEGGWEGERWDEIEMDMDEGEMEEADMDERDMVREREMDDRERGPEGAPWG